MAELVATEKKSLGQILKELAKKTGEFYSDRINIPIEPASKAAIMAKLGGGLQNIGAFAVEQFITTDGYKFLLPNHEWVAFRASGTEPLFRCYIEAKSKGNLKKLDAACRALLAA
jgi:phosphomannomutase